MIREPHKQLLSWGPCEVRSVAVRVGAPHQAWCVLHGSSGQGLGFSFSHRWDHKELPPSASMRSNLLHLWAPDPCKIRVLFFRNVGTTLPFAPSPGHHHCYRWYVYHSQLWVVYLSGAWCICSKSGPWRHQLSMEKAPDWMSQFTAIGSKAMYT